jgi:hypothetical protein
MLLLHLFGALEIGIAIWILFGKQIFIPALIAVVILVLIVVLNVRQMDVLFRDIPILLMAVALLLKEKRTN